MCVSIEFIIIHIQNIQVWKKVYYQPTSSVLKMLVKLIFFSIKQYQIQSKRLLIWIMTSQTHFLFWFILIETAHHRGNTESFKFNDSIDLLLAREVLAVNPYKHYRTAKHHSWQCVANRLSDILQIDDHWKKPTATTCRKRIEIIVERRVNK